MDIEQTAPWLIYENESIKPWYKDTDLGPWELDATSDLASYLMWQMSEELFRRISRNGKLSSNHLRPIYAVTPSIHDLIYISNEMIYKYNYVHIHTGTVGYNYQKHPFPPGARYSIAFDDIYEYVDTFLDKAGYDCNLLKPLPIRHIPRLLWYINNIKVIYTDVDNIRVAEQEIASCFKYQTQQAKYEEPGISYNILFALNS